MKIDKRYPIKAVKFIFYFYFAEFMVLAVRTSALFIAAYFVLYPNVLFEININLALIFAL